MAAIALFMMTSCSEDDTSSTTPVEDNTLVKKTITTTESGQVTATYSYEGTKLKNITFDNNAIIEYTYTGNLITRIKTTQDDFFDPSEDYITEMLYEYDTNNRKIKETFVLPNERRITIYGYLENGSITRSLSMYNSNGDLTYQKSDTVSYSENAINFIDLNSVHTYDTKNHPLKNITGWKEVTSPVNYLNGHNRLTSGTPGSGIGLSYTYTYNENNYPTMSIETDTFGTEPKTTTVQYFYE